MTISFKYLPNITSFNKLQCILKFRIERALYIFGVNRRFYKYFGFELNIFSTILLKFNCRNIGKKVIKKIEYM